METSAWKRMAFLSGTILIFFWILYTSFYTAFFLVFLAVPFFAGALLAFLYRQEKDDFRKFVNWIKIRKFDPIVAFPLTAAGSVPLLMIYVPVVEQGYKRVWRDLADTLLKWFDYFNVGPGNVLWSSWMRKTFPDSWDRPLNYEMYLGFPLITWAMLLAAGLFVLFHMKKSMTRENAWLFALLFGMALCMIAIKRGNGIQCTWYPLWKYFPGVSAIRTVSRMMLILLFPAGILLAFLLDLLQRKLHSWKAGWLVALFLALLLFVDHLNLGGVEEISISWNRAFLESIAAPPEDCRVFFVTQKMPEKPPEDVDKESPQWHDYAMAPAFAQMAAMEISLKYKIKTFHGYTGAYPKNWHLMQIFEDLYPDHLRLWCKENAIHEPVYRYDLTLNRWFGPVDISSFSQVLYDEAQGNGSAAP